jgi:hypothetical protein
MKKHWRFRMFLNQHFNNGEKRQNAVPMSTNTLELSRRSFLKKTAYFTLGSAVIGNSFAAVLAENGGIAFIVAPDDVIASDLPATWALGELKAVLKAQGSTVRIVSQITDTKAKEFCIAVCGMKSSLAQSILTQTKLDPPSGPESLCLVQTQIKGRQVLLAAGTDSLGLVYALTELVDRIQCLSTGRSALEFTEPVIERPASRTRSILRPFSSEIEDKPWFYDHDYWRSYLTMLVTSRFNRLSFTMGMTYDSAREVTDGYFLFPFPFLVVIPGYDVRARGLSDEERTRNLEMLKFIGKETTRRGLRFQIGIWTLTNKWVNSPNATYEIEGLTDSNHTDYCHDALAALLREVPTITGVTFRVHSESGIPEGQGGFWKAMFSAIGMCGRRVEIDMHAKNMEPKTLELALATGQPTVISPKYCGEHLSLPYHQSSIREAEMVSADELTDTDTGVLIGNRLFTRYGYADTLAENRNWDVVFRIWPGTQHFLLNGDPATFAGYGRNASFCGAGGIELTEPLGFKGRQGTGIAGGRNAYADTSLTPHYDFEKYLYTYRLWGRLGYKPDANPETWRRSLNSLFGPAATAVENALAPVSRVLPLFTLAHAAEASNQSYWPEIYTNIPISDSKQQHSNSDTRSRLLFGSVSTFDPQLFQSPDECGEAVVAGRATGKYSPLEVAQWLEDIASSSSTHLNTARTQSGISASAPVFRRFEEDILIQQGLALFFSGKLRSAVLWRIYLITGDRTAGEAAIARYTEGRNAWASMAERAKSVYLSRITYGQRPTIYGHWIDRIPSFDKDIANMREWLEAPMIQENKPDPAAAERVLKIVKAIPLRPFVDAQHTPVERFRSGQPLAVSLRVTSATPRRVMLHYRHVNQAERWKSVELFRNDDTFQGEIPATYTAKRYPLQYYFEVETGSAEATFIPLLAANLANTPYWVIRQTS